jgi:hypothetical protein
MPSLTITSKGQVTLRKDILRHLGVGPGEKVAVDMLPGGRIAVRADRPSGSIAGVFGMLKGKHRPKLSIEEIGEIAASGWSGQSAKSEKPGKLAKPSR